MATTEPERPQRGLTADELGRDVSEAQSAAEEQQGTMARLLAALHPRFVLSQAQGYPTGVKQFLQFCLVLIYPAWVAGVLLSLVVYAVGYGTLWVLFWPLRAWMKRRNPEDYAASQLK